MPADFERDMILGDVRFGELGLIGNPFVRYELDDPIGVGLVCHAQACDLVASLDAESLLDRSRPLWVNKAMSTADYYYTVSVSEVLRSLASPETPLLGIYMPLDIFRLGRIRGALSMTADAISARQFEKTLAAWASSVLSNPDKNLEEFAAIEGVDLPALAERFQTEPAATVAEHFGAARQERQSTNTADIRMRTVYAAEEHLERDPTETEDSEETDADLVEAASADIALGAANPEAEQDEWESDKIADYLVAYARAHVSPVVARALEAYITTGRSAVVEQLRLTKAPKKTLKALMSFASHRYRKIVLIYDRFDAWPDVDDEGRALILGTMSEFRWLVAEHGMLVLVVTEGLAPELEEQFGGARRVEWTLRGLTEMSVKEPPLDLELVQSWIDAASLGDGAPFRADGPELAPIVQASDGLLAPFAKMAAEAVDDAALRGLSTLDAAAVGAGLRQQDVGD